MRGVWKLALAAALIVLLAAAFNACGGDDSDRSSTASTATAAAPENSADGAAAKPEDDGGKKESGDAGSDADGGGTSSDEGSASFRTAGGDNSIQDFGEEADSSERKDAAAALTAFLEGRQNGDWQAQCDNLAKVATLPLEELVSRSPQAKAKGCAAALEALTRGAPASTRANPLTSAGVASLRIEGDRGFALFHGDGGSDYFVPMVKEGGEWKLGAIAPSLFP